MVHAYDQVQELYKIAVILGFALPTVYVQWYSDVLVFHSLEWKLDH